MGVTAGMVGRSLRVLRRILTFAVGQEIIASNPADVLAARGELPKKEEAAPTVALDPKAIEIIRALVLAQDTPLAHRNATMVSVLGYAGLRPEDMYGLRWGDLRGSKMHVLRGMSGDVVGKTKTPKSQCVIDV